MCFQNLKSACGNTPQMPAEESRREYSLLVFIAFITIALGLLAHGYAFFSSSFTHDSLNALYADTWENIWKISLGRVFKPLYQLLVRGNFATPWLIGCLSLIWLGAALYKTVQLFEIKNAACVFLAGGLMITNFAVSATAATYIYDLDANMLAMLCAVLAACQWQKATRISLWAIVFVVLSLGIYQAYLSVCMVLMLMRLIMDVFQGSSLKKITADGLKAVATLALGALAYAALITAIRYFTGIAPNEEAGNSLQQISQLNITQLAANFAATYKACVTACFRSYSSVFPLWLIWLLHIALGVCLVPGLLQLIRNMPRGSRKNCFVVIPLLLLMPPAMLFSTVLSNGNSLHTLMLYALYLAYVFAVIIIYAVPAEKKKSALYIARAVATGIVVFIVCSNIRGANTVYLIKDMQSEAAVSFMTRVLYRMESHADYIPGETPVALIGKSSLLVPPPGAKAYTSLVGISTIMSERNPSAYYDPAYMLAVYKLNTPLLPCEDSVYLQLAAAEEVANMPCYPSEGCIKFIDGVLTVKLGKSQHH